MGRSTPSSLASFFGKASRQFNERSTSELVPYQLLRAKPLGQQPRKKSLQIRRRIISHKLMTYSTNKRAKMASFKDLVSASIEMYDMLLPLSVVVMK